MDSFAFDCTSCGERHAGLPALVYPTPFSYFILSPERRAASVMDSNYCTIEERTFLLRCVFELPIIGHDRVLEWGVWAAVRKADFDRYMDRFEADDRTAVGAMPALLDCPLKGYPDTLDLRCILYPQDKPLRPLLVLEPDQDHVLLRDQVNGISRERAIELIMLFMHPKGNG